MSRTITVGLDGSNESLAAADWAAREAAMYGIPLRVVHAGEQQPHEYVPFAGERIPLPGTDRSARLLAEAKARLAHRHSGVQVTAEQIAGRPVNALIAAAGEAEVLVLGSRGLGKVAGAMLGSVALAVVARAERPVVLVRAMEDIGPEGRPEAFEEADAATPYRDVVLGLDLRAPDDHVLEFAFDAASRRATRLRVIHGWGGVISPSALAGDAGPAQDGQTAVAAVLHPWRDKFPGVEVTEEAVIGDAGAHLVDVSQDASMIVVGRRNRTVALGSRIGPVASTVLQHAVAPVAVVPHD
ncbi:universal stress protein [Streptomyces sp. NBC_01451]|uniref:universal stress protein n=1 Tax=Streptomyces sp. NBC_01451 TaxID=2903872 RepID=UPI002E334389|nr:universal stress protein [Streptomyces sp. NBC_01451]